MTVFAVTMMLALAGLGMMVGGGVTGDVMADMGERFVEGMMEISGSDGKCEKAELRSSGWQPPDASAAMRGLSNQRSCEALTDCEEGSCSTSLFKWICCQHLGL